MIEKIKVSTEIKKELAKNRSIEEYDKILNMIKKFDFKLPGHCNYKNNIIKYPDILKQNEMSTICTRAEIEECMHYYNYCKKNIYSFIMNHESSNNIVSEIKTCVDIRWKIVALSDSLLNWVINKIGISYEYHSDGIILLYRIIDRYNPNYGFTPGTYIIRSLYNSLISVKKGNKNYQNLSKNKVSLSDCTSEDKKYNKIIYEYECEYRELIFKLLKFLPDVIDQKIIIMRYGQNMQMQDISNELGLSVFKIKTMIDNSLRKMKYEAAVKFVNISDCVN